MTEISWLLLIILRGLQFYADKYFFSEWSKKLSTDKIFIYEMKVNEQYCIP